MLEPAGADFIGPSSHLRGRLVRTARAPTLGTAPPTADPHVLVGQVDEQRRLHQQCAGHHRWAGRPDGHHDQYQHRNRRHTTEQPCRRLSKSSLTGTVAASSSAVDSPEWQAVARAYIRRGVRGVRDPRVHRALQLIASDHAHAEIAADLGMSVAYLDSP
jgi:hypothetical protein